MATHSNILAWEIRRREEPGGLQSKRVGCDLAAKEQPQYCIVNYKYYAGLPVSRTYSSCSTETFYSFKHNSSFCPPVLLAPGNHSILLLLLLSRFSRVRLCATPQKAAHQAPLSLRFSRQEYWSGLPFPSPMRESEVAQSCPTLRNPVDCSPPGSLVHGIFQARVQEWVATAFSDK